MAVYQGVHQVSKNLTTGFHESVQAGSSTPHASATQLSIPGGGGTHSSSGTEQWGLAPPEGCWPQRRCPGGVTGKDSACRRCKSGRFDLWV